MRKYFTYFRVSLISAYAYKADFILYMAISVIFYYISVALWTAVYKSSGVTTIDTYTLSNTISYFLITAVLFKLDLSDTLYLAEEIWNGQFSNDLIKPWNVIGVHFVYMLSELFLGLFTFLPFLILMVATTHSYLSLPTMMNAVLFIITVILALVMLFFLNLILHAFTFHFGDQYGQIQLANFAISFLAGGMFPLSFLPSTLRGIFLALPFKFAFFVPAEIYLGKVDWQTVMTYWLQMVIWIAVFYLLFMLVYKTGLKKYSGTGR